MPVVNWLPRKLKARVTLLILVVFAAGIWVLSVFASQILIHGIQEVSGAQQLSMATYIAEETEEQLSNRVRALEVMAVHMTPKMMATPKALQDYLYEHFVLQDLFNHGTVVLDANGIAIGSFPQSLGRLGMNYMSTDAAALAIKEGKSSIGKPTIGKISGVPLFVMAAPIRNASGAVIGAMTGVTRLDAPNFLDKITRGAPGNVASYVLVAPKHSMLITGSDKAYIMRPTPALGESSLLNSFARGEEGVGLFVNRQGTEELMAAKQIPIAGWYVGVSVPRSLVFSPVAQMQKKLVWIAALVLMAVVVLSWLVLRKQLSPLDSAINTFTRLRLPEQPLNPLAIAREDEIGELFQSFNFLLQALALREAELRSNKLFKQAILDAVGVEVVVLNELGEILAVNEPWLQFAAENGADPKAIGVGANYLVATDSVKGVALRIQEVIDRRVPRFSLEYPCHTDTRVRWFQMNVLPIRSGEGGSVVVTHMDITDRVQAQSLLEDSDQRLRLALDAAKIGDFELDLQTMKAVRSRRHGEIFGHHEPMPEWDIHVFLDHVHPEDRIRVGEGFRACLDTGHDLEGEFRIVWADSSVHWVWLKGHLFNDTDGHPIKMLGVVFDITDIKKNEDELRIAAIAFETRDPTMISDANGVIVRVNQAFTEHTGYSAQEAIGQTPRMLQSGRNDANFYKAMWETLIHRGSWQGEIWDRNKDGRVLPKWLTISAVKDPQGNATHYIGVHHDISEQKEAEEALMRLNRELEASHQILRDHAAQNESTREEERKHIAREVHDELGQVLTALRMDISLIGLRFSEGNPELLIKIAETKTLVDRAIQGVRNVAMNLRPTALDMGLIPAIEWLSSEFTRNTGVSCMLRAREETVNLDESRAVVVFRIIQESLTNITRYAKADTVVITIGRRGNELWLEVRDNGRGFDANTTSARNSFGLLGMRERALTLGGQVTIESTLGKGTVVAMTIPLVLDGKNTLANT